MASSSHRTEMENSSLCGCFYCLATFTSTEIIEWIDEPNGGETAICPKCGIINVKGVDILLYQNNHEDFISLTDIARHKDPHHTDDLVKNWMRNRNTIELLGFWETIYNPDFKPVEFDGFRMQAGLNRPDPKVRQRF